mgnify:CR=1 FL=1
MSAMSPDVIDCLLEDHESMKTSLAQLRNATLETSRKRAIYKRFLPLLNAHTFGEEQTVMARGLEKEELRPKVLEGLEEHHLSEYLLDRIRLAVNDEQWLARLDVFCETLEHHLLEEEEEAFPMMREIFTSEEREEMGRRYLEARNGYQLGGVVPLAAVAS